ncbi:pseudouridine synthase [Eubacterium sp. 1001713B170207_170306_E7]|uniref:pseudouridine synthase n=1 Tax=Eubacterium sp. 1001713B170207_170306_E7 TaxID=2787097 RepID=UPI001897B3FA|nr:pseudouridine synthase [Eubacterium sp. 1001713B170207_170306_E7]
MRLQKYMAQCGVASRRKSEELIAAGRVCVNGETVLTPGFQVNPGVDTVTVNGKAIAEDQKIYVLLNKPKGVVSTSADRHADQTVMDLLPVRERLFTVGRLDKDTEGLLILTNDGDLTFRLTHPSHEFDKVYEGLVKGIPAADELRRFAEGVEIEEDDHTLHTTAPASVQVLKTYRSTALLQMTIHEGRKRQIRKMCAAIHHPVIHLKRVAIGSITLKGLKAGEWRYLTEEEIRYLRGEKDD